MDEKDKGYTGFWKYLGMTLSGIGCLVFIWIFIMLISLMIGLINYDF